jgi:hypothetical protein
MTENFAAFKRVYQQWERRIQTAEKQDGERERAMRLFNIKLRLALGMIVDFDSNVALTRTPKVKACYILLCKLTALWNAFESFIAYTKHIYGVKAWYDIPKCPAIADVASEEILSSGMETIKGFCNTASFRRDFAVYGDKVEAHLSQRENGKGKKNLEQFSLLRRYFENGKKTTPVAFLSMIDIERNLFYHSGEASKMGMTNYGNREKLLETCRAVLSEYLLHLAVNALERELEK